jgi:5-formyltetrahydrofolate cyclo-ligase
VTEKEKLRLRFKELAKEFFAAHDAVQLAGIHFSLAEKLGDYLRLTGKLFERVAIYEPMRYELPVGEIMAQVEELNDAELLIPQWNAEKMWFDKTPDLVITPGLFVDKAGSRLGRGKGYYDRYFAENPIPVAHRIFLGYDFQFLDQLPSDDKDQPVTGISPEP